MLILVLSVPSALAFDVPGTSGNVQTLHPSVDAQQTMWTDDASLKRSGTLTARALGSFTSRPLLWQVGDGDPLPVIGSAWQVDLLGAVYLGPLRLGLDLPLLLGGTSAVFDGGATGLGDVAFDGKLTLLNPADRPLGVAITTRIGLPTATVNVPLRNGGIAVEVAGVVDYSVGNALRLVANVGARFAPPTTLGDLAIDDQLIARLGAGIPIGGRAGVSADLASRLAFSAPLSLGAPAEVMLGGWFDVTDVWTLRAGVGRGFSGAVGSPGARALVSLAFEPERDDAARELRAERRRQRAEERAQAQAQSTSGPDLDGDGIPNRDDACPEDPEDSDGYQDNDGCPEPVKLGIHVQDADGATVQGAFTFLTCGEIDVRLSADAVAEVPPGSCSINVAAQGWSFAEDTFTVEDGPPVEKDIVLEPMEPMSHIRVVVVDGDGDMIDVAQWSVGKDPTLLPITQGRASTAVKPGTWVISVQRDGYISEQHTLELEPGQQRVVEVVLRKEP